MLGILRGRQPLPFGLKLLLLNAVPTHGPCRFLTVPFWLGFRELENFCGFRRNGFSHSRENDLADQPGREFVARLPPWVFCPQKQPFRTEAELPFLRRLFSRQFAGQHFLHAAADPVPEEFLPKFCVSCFASPGDTFWIGVTSVCRSTFLSDFFKSSKFVIQFFGT